MSKLLENKKVYSVVLSTAPIYSVVLLDVKGIDTTEKAIEHVKKRAKKDKWIDADNVTHHVAIEVE